MSDTAALNLATVSNPKPLTGKTTASISHVSLELRQKFANISLLLKVVTLLNDGESPTLEYEESLRERIERSKARERSDKSPHTVMEASLALFVRNTDIVAGMLFGGTSSSVVAMQQPLLRPEEDVPLSPEEDEEDVPSPDVPPSPEAEAMWAVKGFAGGNWVAVRNLDHNQPNPTLDDTYGSIPLSGGRWADFSREARSGEEAAITKLMCHEQMKKPKDRRPFSDHVATIRDYMNSYMSNGDNEPPNYELFTRYIVATCWKKMSRRASHWASITMLKQLHTAHPEGPVFVKEIKHGGKDIRLAKTICTLVRNDDSRFLRAVMQGVMNKDEASMTEESFPVPKLHARAKEIVEASSHTNSLYDVETASEFHTLLASSLVYYARSVEALNIYYSESTRNQLLSPFSLVQKVAAIQTILYPIIYSNAFDCHIASLVKSRWLSLPMNTHMSKIEGRQWEEKHIICQARSLTQKATNNTASDNTGDIKAVDNTGATDDTDATDEYVEEGFPTTYLNVQSDDCPVLIKSWLKLLIKHYSAQRTMERACQQPSFKQKSVDIMLLDFKAVDPKIPPSWKSMQEIIEEAITDSDKAQAAGIYIQCIKDDVITNAAVNQGPHKMFFKNFANVIANNRTGYSMSRVHCEAAIVAFASAIASGVVPQDSVLHKLKARIFLSLRFSFKDINNVLQDMDLQAVAVSKLCCPACWEFLRLMGGEDENFKARGRHSAVCQVHLPPWIDEDIAKAMVERFMTHLRVELARFNKKNTAKTHARSSSSESVGSNFSADSQGDDTGDRVDRAATQA